MADIRMTILEKYGIDVNEIDLLKIYKIDNAEISDDELNSKIAECRKKWNQSVNGANERLAERDRAHLEKADKYELILKDKKLRKKLFEFYNKCDNEMAETEFAKEYFSLVATSKKIKKKDVDFFFTYFQDERKNKKSILEMLLNDFKVHGLGKDRGTEESEEEIANAGKKKNKTSPLIVNLFQEITILKLKKCEYFFETASHSEDICKRYPAVRESLYDMLKLSEIEDIKILEESISKWREDVFAQRQERGQEYASLVDLFNTLSDVLEYSDVVDNFKEFKLLVKYPKLTPYMYQFDDMKPGTLKQIFEIAAKDYPFRDINDFILTYFLPIYDNFNIHVQSVKGIMSKAEKKAKSNKIVKSIEEKLGWNRRKRMPVIASIVHLLVYWPVFLIYLIFELTKILFTKLKLFTVPVFITLFVACNWLFPIIFDMDNMLIIRKIIFKDEWYQFLESFTSFEVINGFSAFCLSLYAIAMLLLAYVIPPLIVADLIYETSAVLEESFDWKGLDRTFDNIFDGLRNKTRELYSKNKILFLKKKIPQIVGNILCVIAVALVIHFIPVAANYFSETTGYFQEEETTEVSEVETVTEPEEIKYTYYVIDVNLANIREGAGTEYNVITTAKNGESFMGTGNNEILVGGTWYEIYLNDEKTMTGWVHNGVVRIVEK